MQTISKEELLEHELFNPLRGHQLGEVEEYVATLLLSATSAKPIGIAEIRTHARLALNRNVDDREVKAVIRGLRKSHHFPILSRKGKPAGYWWCGSADEMRAFIRSFRAQAMDELHTLSQIVKHNYPELAGQLTLEEL